EATSHKIRGGRAPPAGTPSRPPRSDGRNSQMRPTLIAVIALAAANAQHLEPNTIANLSFADIAQPRRGEWPTYDGTLSGNRFSPLDQVNATTIQRLAPKWMFTIPGAPRPLQTTPLVVGGVMYVTSVNEAYALDA